MTGDPELIGSTADVLSWSEGEGQVRVHGEHWQARATMPLRAGKRVRVFGRDRLILFVEPDPQLKPGGRPEY